MLHKQILTELDHPQVTIDHGKIIREKVFLRKLYEDFYHFFKKTCSRVPPGLCIELGSGGGILKEIVPQIYTSDILQIPQIDLCFSATALPFQAESLSALFLFNVLHHIKDPSLFFHEAQKCLALHGKIVMIEPANTPFAWFIYNYFHHEPFNPKGGWIIEEGGPLSGANGALPWILFQRDRKKFQKEFPLLKIEPLQYHTPLRYLLSGGFSLPQLFPSSLYPAIHAFEVGISPLNKFIGLFMTIELTKIKEKPRFTFSKTFLFKKPQF
jgi:SAM-dependent methyltransferase